MKTVDLYVYFISMRYLYVITQVYIIWSLIHLRDKVIKFCCYAILWPWSKAGTVFDLTDDKVLKVSVLLFKVQLNFNSKSNFCGISTF